MEIISIKGYKKYLGISLIKICNRKFFKNLINEVLSNSNDTTVQLLNPKGVAGVNHIYHAVRLSLKALAKNRLISKNFRVELLLYLAARRQISESIRVLGVNEKSNSVVIIVVDTSRIKIRRFLENLILELGEELSITDIGKEGIINPKYLSEAFSINQQEIDSTILNPQEKFKSILEKLVVEKIALFSI